MKDELQGALSALLYQALGEPLGLLVQTSDFQNLRQKLYQARAACGDPALGVLMIRVSPFEGGNMVICKATAKEIGL